ncbi:MAG: metal-dependent hydrolase [Hornefia butyriciproducens]|uniref:metal-dependent hydrolase n=1 Tax=Hornefia butyriciproducens TaxID=2652293 RepID=UPI002A765A8E|nr:metal-dependent hydrolase [Hornefia butyriciproducens]MDY2990593.1 metal-dependent hydrolase [Hornefia butyriciproducens]
MMGYTHVAWGAAGAVSLAALGGDGTPGTYVMAALAGGIGGAAVDIEVKDQLSNPKVTDAGRTRLAVLGLIGLGALSDWIFKLGVLSEIINSGYVALGGVISFLVFMAICHFTPHRTFTHSLFFIIISGFCIGAVYPDAAVYYAIGALLHVILDLFNHKVIEGHGVWLLYPIKFGDGIALKLCKAGGTGNKVLYFIGLALFALGTVMYLYMYKDNGNITAPIIIAIYLIVVLHFVRRKSERELRHIAHMHGH